MLVIIFNLLKEIFDICTENIIGEFGSTCINNFKFKKIYESEKKRTYGIIHELIDRNEDNTFIISDEFYYFFNYNVKEFVIDLLSCKSSRKYDISLNKQIEKIFDLYHLNFQKTEPFMLSLGENFIKRYIEICMNFKKDLYHKLISDDMVKLLEFELNYNMLLEISENISKVLSLLTREINYTHVRNNTEHTALELNSKAGKNMQKFAEIYEKKLIFEYDEQNKCLKDVFIWPEYKTEFLSKEQDDINEIIQNFLSGNLSTYLFDKGISKLKIEREYNALLILGMGGMGKSSLLCRIAYDILNFEIPVSTKKVFFIKCNELKCNNAKLVDNIADYIGIVKDELRDTIIILDAYDEYILENTRKQDVLESFCQDIIKLNSKVIITSRENYIIPESLSRVFVAKLLTFNKIKRKEWISKYNINLPEAVKHSILHYRDENDFIGGEFIGIPIILYLVASNSIVISYYKSKYDFYDYLFGKYGIWYKRRYDINHPALTEHNNLLYEFILSVAENMFCNQQTIVNNNEIANIIKNISSKQDLNYLSTWYGIITYFRKNQLNEIEFAHKSIYEYYIARRIYYKLLQVLTQKTVDDKVNILFSLFSKSIVTKEIQYFLSGFVKKDMNEIKSTTVEETLKDVLNVDWLISNLKNIQKYDELNNYFANTFNCLYTCMNILTHGKQKNIFEYVGTKNIKFYLQNETYQYLYMHQINLSNMIMSKCIFRNTDMRNANLENSDFSYCDFRGSNLEKSNLKNTNLFGSILSDANLSYVDLRSTNLNNIVTNKKKENYMGTKITIEQIKYFWPEISWFHSYFEIYIGDKIACESEVQLAFRKIGKMICNQIIDSIR